MRLTFTIEITRDRPEPPPEREVDMGSLVERADRHRIGFLPNEDYEYDERGESQ